LQYGICVADLEYRPAITIIEVLGVLGREKGKSFVEKKYSAKKKRAATWHSRNQWLSPTPPRLARLALSTQK